MPKDTKTLGYIKAPACESRGFVIYKKGCIISTHPQVYESHSIGYERNPKARAECLKHYGYKCSVCGFDFEKEYGEIGRGFIEVHHIVPVSTIREEYVVNPIRDLRPLCSNCHSMVHRREPVISIEELKEMRKK